MAETLADEDGDDEPNEVVPAPSRFLIIPLISTCLSTPTTSDLIPLFRSGIPFQASASPCFRSEVALCESKNLGDLLVHQYIRSGGYRSLAEGESVDSKGDNGRSKIVDLSGPDGASVQGGDRGAGVIEVLAVSRCLRGFRRPGGGGTSGWRHPDDSGHGSGGGGSDVRDQRYVRGSGYGYGSGGGSDGRYFGGSSGDYVVCGYHQYGWRSFSPESFRLGTYSVNEE